jgi:hypothetical protein
MFIWFEEKLEGAANKRRKLDAAPWSGEKLARKGAKHLAWILLSLGTGLTFVAYFQDVFQLVPDFFTLQAGGWVIFWVLLFAACTYGNAGWMRAIMCIHMCPYARFQSAMFDKDTFIVGYDASAARPVAPVVARPIPRRWGWGLHRLRPLRAGLPDRHRHPRRPAVRVHQLRRLRRRLRSDHGADGVSEGAHQLHHRAQAGPQ